MFSNYCSDCLAGEIRSEGTAMRKFQMRGPPPVGENLVPFPALVRLAPLANKRALLAQTRQAATWLEYAVMWTRRC
jgi:hypothetical protein